MAVEKLYQTNNIKKYLLFSKRSASNIRDNIEESKETKLSLVKFGAFY